MSLSISQWHARYLQQALWTKDIRGYLFSKVGIQPTTRLLDIGCGTGILEKELASYPTSLSFALDIDYHRISYAKAYAPKSHYTLGDAACLPFTDDSIDLSFCHYLLLWIHDVHRTLSEMFRVTRSDGYILALAEPDYGGRLDYPEELAQIGTWQIEGLRKQGANPNIGRELRSLFSKAGLLNVEVGVLGGQWTNNSVDSGNQLEWDIIQSDLSSNTPLSTIDRLKKLDQSSRETGQRILFVPTFYAIGMVQK
jgi:ubiquinone/menaquinone biosynthesis C-methylase UbiE